MKELINYHWKIVYIKKNISTILFLFITSFNTFATDFYFSSSMGDDSRSVVEAQNESTPWKSIDKLNSITPILNGGDKVFFKSGDVFIGTILITKSGADGNPITFTSYGSGAKPIITSLEPVTGWQSIGGGIYEADVSNLSGESIQVVLIDNTIRAMGRFPNGDASNAGYLTIKSVNNNLSINGDALPGDFSGGEVVIRKNNWIIDRHQIQSTGGSTINFLNNANTIYNPQSGYGYFVQNHKNALDQFGEWAYSKSTRKIAVYFGGQNPSNSSVQVAKREHLVVNSPFVRNLTFRNLEFKGSNKNLLMIQKSGGVTVENCSFDFAGENAIFGSEASDFIVRNNQFNRALSGTIFFWYGTPRANISDNVIENTMPFRGMAKSSDLTGIGIYVAGDANNAVIERNRILNSGFNGIHFGGNYTIIKNNLVDTFCLWKQDGGGIYTNSDGLTNQNNTGREIIGNIIRGGVGAQEGSIINYKLAEGIYIDDNSEGVKILQNTITEINGKGIYIHNNRYVEVLQNTVYKVANQLQITHDHLGQAVRNVRVEGNQLSSVFENEVAYSISSTQNDINQMVVSNNNYFLDPFHKAVILHSKDATEGPLGSERNLANWSEAFGFDQSSKVPKFELERYKVISSADVKASNFDSDANIIAGTYNGNSQWTGSGISGGSWSVTPTGSNMINSFIQIGATSPGDEFLIEFDAKSGASNKSVELLLEKTFNQNQEGNLYYFASSSEVQTVKILLKSQISSGSESIVFRIPGSIQSLTIDNLKVTKVKTEAIPMSEQVFFQYNFSGNPVTHSLNGVYLNAKGERFDRSVTIPAYGSALLAKLESSSAEPENQAPSISIIEPIQNQSYTIGQEILIRTNASDPENKIQKVEFFQGDQLIATVDTAPFQFSWKNVPVGNYVIKAKVFDDQGLTAESSQITISVKEAAPVNQAPTVGITQPSQNQAFQFGQDILIQANASDPEGKVQKVEFFQGNQVLAVVESAPFEFIFKNASVGNYVIKAKVFDDQNLTAESSQVNISVIASTPVNQAPSVGIIQPSQNQTFIIGQDIMIQANASDPEGKVQKVEFFQGDQVLAIVETAPFEFNFQNAPVGNYVIKAKVFDDQNLTAESTQLNISVVAPSPVNQSPSVSIIQPSQNQTFIFGQEILIRSNASDPEGKIQKVEFFQGDQVLAIIETAPFEFNLQGAPVGNYVIKAKVFDDQGLTAESSIVNISVIESTPVNQAPSVSIIQPSQNQTFIIGQDIMIQANASDPEEKVQKVEFFQGDQVIAIVETAPFEFNLQGAPVANYVIKAKVFDDQGLTAESSQVNISVIEESPVNQAPSVSIIQPIQNQTFILGQDILIQANASDPENKIQKVEFFYGEEMIAIVDKAPYEVLWKNAPLGSHILKTKIFDDQNLTAESARINISAVDESTVNLAPSVSILDPIQDKVFTFGKDILIVANASDPENKIQKVEFFYGEEMIAIVDKAPYEVIWKNAPAGDHILKTKIFDDKNLTSESSRVNISVNHAPRVSITVPVQNQNFTFGEDILIRTDAFDYENEIQKVEFFYGEEMIAIIDKAPYEVIWKNAPAGNHILKTKIFDNENLTAESSRIAISVNQAPTISITQPGQNQIFTFGQDITIKTNAYDPENKIQKVEFFYGEQIIAIVDKAPYEVTWKKAPVGNYILKTKIFDDKGLTAESSRVSIKVENSLVSEVNLRVIGNENDEVYTTSDVIPLEVLKTIDNVNFDSVAIYQDNNLLEVSYSEPFNFLITELAEGEQNLTAQAFQAGEVIESEVLTIHISSDTLITAELEIINPSKEIQSIELFEYTIGPNPTDDVLNLYMNGLPKDQLVEIEIFDINGVSMNSIKTNTEIGTITIELGTYPAGIYFIRIMGQTMDYGTKRIIKN